MMAAVIMSSRVVSALPSQNATTRGCVPDPRLIRVRPVVNASSQHQADGPQLLVRSGDGNEHRTLGGRAAGLANVVDPR
jgi:hypothetical protein